jgi:hypothetical protein
MSFFISDGGDGAPGPTGPTGPPGAGVINWLGDWDNDDGLQHQ